MSEEYEAYLLWKTTPQWQMDGFRKEIRELKAKNAKLRKLASELHSLATHELVYLPYDQCDEWDKRMDAAEETMHELGIEVNA